MPTHPHLSALVLKDGLGYIPLCNPLKPGHTPGQNKHVGEGDLCSTARAGVPLRVIRTDTTKRRLEPNVTPQWTL